MKKSLVAASVFALFLSGCFSSDEAPAEAPAPEAALETEATEEMASEAGEPNLVESIQTAVEAGTETTMEAAEEMMGDAQDMMAKEDKPAEQEKQQ